MDAYDVVIVILICVALVCIALIPLTFDGFTESRNYCEEWGGDLAEPMPGKLFVWGDWTAVCIDRNPDRILYISGEK